MNKLEVVIQYLLILNDEVVPKKEHTCSKNTKRIFV